MSYQTGPRNLITDVPGIQVGNAEDHAVRSGVSVVLPDAPAVAAVDVRGGGPGTRETDALDPACLVEAVHGITLSGGSAYGLDAAGGTMSWLAEQGRGFQLGEALVPIVPSAILFDLLNGGDKDWGKTPPYRALAREACSKAGQDFALGNVGAGLGATAGPLKGGLGSASVENGHFNVGALAVVNPFGSVVQPGSSSFYSWALEQDGELGGQVPPDGPVIEVEADYAFDGPQGGNTTLVVVATDANLSKAQAQRIAIMAHDGFSRAIRPVHTPLDGDTVFVLSTGRVALANPVGDVARLGMMAADVTARAIARGVYEAESLGDFPSYRSHHEDCSGAKTTA